MRCEPATAVSILKGLSKSLYGRGLPILIAVGFAGLAVFCSCESRKLFA